MDWFGWSLQSDSQQVDIPETESSISGHFSQFTAEEEPEYSSFEKLIANFLQECHKLLIAHLSHKQSRSQAKIITLIETIRPELTNYEPSRSPLLGQSRLSNLTFQDIFSHLLILLRELTNCVQKSFMRTEDNPADFLTCSIKSSLLMNSQASNAYLNKFSDDSFEMLKKQLELSSEMPAQQDNLDNMNEKWAMYDKYDILLQSAKNLTARQEKQLRQFQYRYKSHTKLDYPQIESPKWRKGSGNYI